MLKLQFDPNQRYQLDAVEAISRLTAVSCNIDNFVIFLVYWVKFRWGKGFLFWIRICYALCATCPP
jgi:hypothetical protein